MNVPHIRGVVCPMVTPFDADNHVNYDQACQVAEFLLGKGVDCLMIGGTTGEGMLLNLGERKALCDAVVRCVAGRAPIIAHTGCIGTADTIDLTRHAAAAGAAVASLIVPYFFTFDDDSLFAHFTAVARAVPDFPLFLYVFPGNAKNDISPALLLRLREAAPNLVGIKVSNPDLLRFQEYVRVGGEHFMPFCGVDGLMLPALALGSMAQVSGNANVCPEAFHALYEAFAAGDLERAREQQAYINCIRVVLRDGMTPAYFKAGLRLRGVEGGRTRPPVRELSAAEEAAVEEGLRALGVIE
jgi:dihydrodipicolinate synthase/N-acetylneuraminate lyase